MTKVPTSRPNVLLSLAAVVVVVYGLQAAKVLLVPFIVASFLALMTMRPLLWLQSRRVPAGLAVLLIVVVILLVLSVIAAIVGTSVAEFTAALPSYQARLDAIVKRMFELLAGVFGAGLYVEGLRDLLNPGYAMRVVATILNAVREVMTSVLLIVLTMVFILLEASNLPAKFRAALIESGGIDDERGFERWRLFLNGLGRYLGIKTMVSMMTGLLIGLLTWAVGLDFPLLWGMLAFLLNYIPTIGSIIAAVPAVLLAVLQLGVGPALLTLAGFVAVNIGFGNFLEPRWMGYGLRISPLIVFVGLFFWGWVFGPVGMLLSVPLTMTLRMALESDPRTEWLGRLLGSARDAEFRPEQSR